MKDRIMYFELKTGYIDDGPAWIGKASFSKTGTTIYSNGKAFSKGSSFSSNFYDIETGEEYWISGIKKRGTNRHDFGKGKIKIDRSILNQYLEITEQDKLSDTQYEVTELIQTIDLNKFNAIKNQKLI